MQKTTSFDSIEDKARELSEAKIRASNDDKVMFVSLTKGSLYKPNGKHMFNVTGHEDKLCLLKEIKDVMVLYLHEDSTRYVKAHPETINRDLKLAQSLLPIQMEGITNIPFLQSLKSPEELELEKNWLLPENQVAADVLLNNSDYSDLKDYMFNRNEYERIDRYSWYGRCDKKFIEKVLNKCNVQLNIEYYNEMLGKCS